MSVTRDKNTDKWMAQIRVTDWTGKTIHKKKRGFDTKREAQQWERDVIHQANRDVYKRQLHRRTRRRHCRWQTSRPACP